MLRRDTDRIYEAADKICDVLSGQEDVHVNLEEMAAALKRDWVSASRVPTREEINALLTPGGNPAMIVSYCDVGSIFPAVRDLIEAQFA